MRTFRLFLPQRSPPGWLQCDSDRPGVVAVTVPVARPSAFAPGLSCIWAPSGTRPLRVTELGTELAEGPQDHPGPLTAAGDWSGKGGWRQMEDGESVVDEGERSSGTGGVIKHEKVVGEYKIKGGERWRVCQYDPWLHLNFLSQVSMFALTQILYSSCVLNLVDATDLYKKNMDVLCREFPLYFMYTETQKSFGRNPLSNPLKSSLVWISKPGAKLRLTFDKHHHQGKAED